MIRPDTFIQFGNVIIHEPVTVFTNIILSCMCLIFFLIISKQKSKKESDFFWSYFFLATSIGSFLGIFTHAFFPSKEGLLYMSIYLPLQVLNISSAYFTQRATIASALAFFTYTKTAIRITSIQLALFILAIFIFKDYKVVTIYSALALIPVMIIHFMYAKNDKTYLWIAYGIVVLFLTGIVHATKYSFHRYFNDLDIAHVLLMITFSMFFVGVKRKKAA